MTAILPGTTLPSRLDRRKVIGLPVNVGTLATVAQEIMRLARRGVCCHVRVANLHKLVEARRGDRAQDGARPERRGTAQGGPD